MKKYLIVICLLILTSCIQNNERNQDATINAKYNENLSLSEPNESNKVLTDFHKNNNGLRDTKTKNQLSNNHKPDNK